jgi:hypothetical protein
MPAQNQPTQELTLSEKAKIVQYLALFPALSIMVFIRRKIGYRMLAPSRLFGIAMFLWFINGICNIGFLIFQPAGLLFSDFPTVMLMFGFFQRFRRWNALCRGERWHTMSPGISYLEVLPLPAFLKSHRRIYRFVEPLLCFIASMFIGVLFSEPLARWIAFSSICLFIYEQALYEKQLDRDLDILDGLIAAEVQGETVEYFSGEQPEAKERGIQETGGIPTGVAFDIHRQIEQRRARQAAEEEKSKAEALLRQVAQVKMAAGVTPKDITPPATQLPPRSAPDNLAPETFDLPPSPPETPG